MSSIGPSLPRLRLDAASYESLRQQVLRRDGWRCQLCGTMSNLEVHHKQFRSHSGEDSELNLITLCNSVPRSDAPEVVTSDNLRNKKKCADLRNSAERRRAQELGIRKPSRTRIWHKGASEVGERNDGQSHQASRSGAYWASIL